MHANEESTRFRRYSDPGWFKTIPGRLFVLIDLASEDRAPKAAALHPLDDLVRG
jgi:hypothetical protein